MAAVKLRLVAQRPPRHISIRDFWRAHSNAVERAIDTLVDAGFNRSKLLKLRPSKSTRGKPGAPRKWEQRDYAVLLAMFANGQRNLKREGKRVTDETAVLAIIESRCKALGWKPAEIRAGARALGKRLSDARKSVRK